jgi:dihydroorotase-like cyclic amidohydrolase
MRNRNIFEVGSGTPGIETTYPLMLTAVNQSKISLNNAVQATSINPAKRFGLYPRKGTISLNSDADLVIIDLKREYTLKNEELFTKQKVSVFDGMKFQGKIVRTFVRGKLVYDKGEFPTGSGYGRLVIPVTGRSNENYN